MKSKPDISIIDFVTSDQLLGLSISEPQEVLLRSIYGLPLTKYQLDVFRQCTGRENYPRHGFSEVTALCGASPDFSPGNRIACLRASKDSTEQGDDETS